MARISTTVRCFRLLQDEPCQGRRGIWLMTAETGYRGVFFHGDKEEAQAPRYSVEELEKLEVDQGKTWFHVQ